MSILNKMFNKDTIDFTKFQKTNKELLQELVTIHKHEIINIKKPKEYGIEYYDVASFYIEDFIERYRELFDLHEIDTKYNRHPIRTALNQRVRTAQIKYNNKTYDKPSKEIITKIGKELTVDSKYATNTGGMLLMMPHLTEERFLETAKSITDTIMDKTKDSAETRHDKLELFKMAISRIENNTLDEQ